MVGGFTYGGLVLGLWLLAVIWMQRREGAAAGVRTDITAFAAAWRP